MGVSKKISGNFTMVARCGDGKHSAIAYTLIASDYQIVNVSAEELKASIKDGSCSVANMGIDQVSNELVSTNGAMDKYTLIDSASGMIVGQAKAVILNRVEQNGKLIGYTVFNQFGNMVEMSVVDASVLANKRLISNGKVKHTDSGDIVSAIGGTYPLREITISAAPKGNIKISIMYFAMNRTANAEYTGAIFTCESATQMSEIINEVTKANASLVGKVVNKIPKSTVESTRNSMAVQRIRGNEVYAVVDLSTLKKIMAKANAKVVNASNLMLLSIINSYDKDGNAVELTGKLTSDWKLAEGKGEPASKEIKLFAELLSKAYGMFKVSVDK